MNKFLTLLLGSLFALATSLPAQQDDQSPGPNKKQAGKERSGKKAAAQAKPAVKAQPPKKAPPAREAKRLPNAEAIPKARIKAKPPEAAPVAKRAEEPATPNAKRPSAKRPAAPAQKPAGRANRPDNVPVAKSNAPARKPDARTVKRIKTAHANFKAQPRPDRVPTVTFTERRRLQGSDQWQGAQYGVYRSYRPERHDQGYYRSRYQRVELISGGYYYYNEGYWYPAWGYDTSNQYYAYDAPIYTGQRAEPLDRVIADVQAVLQEQNYYTGEVDGLLGPLTREALISYQADNGLYQTAVIDEPTLASLGLD